MKSFSGYLFCFLLLYTSCHPLVIEGDMLPYRTIIVYMAADNELSDDAWDNLGEMQFIYEENGVNLVVFLDPSDDFPQILKIERGGFKLVKTYSEFNSADAIHLKQVLNDAISLFPAASYGLVLWSHGTSWMPEGVPLRSFGEDDGRQMDITALAAALPVKFDFILFDACLMGSVEALYELRDKADFIIASPTEVINMGFPYEPIIQELIQNQPDLMKVAAAYHDFYDDLPGAYRSASISLIKTSELEQLAALTGQLVAEQPFNMRLFERTSVQRLDVYEEQYAFDFLDFMEKVFPTADLAGLKRQLDKTVLYKVHTPRLIDEFDILAFCGLSCYIPHPHRDDLNVFYQQLAWCLDSGFYRFFE